MLAMFAEIFFKIFSVDNPFSGDEKAYLFLFSYEDSRAMDRHWPNLSSRIFYFCP